MPPQPSTNLPGDRRSERKTRSLLSRLVLYKLHLDHITITLPLAKGCHWRQIDGGSGGVIYIHAYIHVSYIFITHIRM